MNGLGDSLTIGIVLTLIFGAVCFYLYSRLSQNEKRVALLENLLLNLKMSTEASLAGPDMVEPTSLPGPLDTNDVDDVSETEYAEMLKEIPAESKNTENSQQPPIAPVNNTEEINVDNMTIGTNTIVEETEELLRTLEATPISSIRKMDANYESMSLKELQSLARQRGLSGIPSRKRELIDALKKQGQSAPIAPLPLPEAEDSLGGANEGNIIELN